MVHIKKQGGALGTNGIDNYQNNANNGGNGGSNDDFKEVTYTTPGFESPPRIRQRSDAQNQGKFIQNVQNNPNTVSNRFAKPIPPSGNRGNQSRRTRQQWGTNNNLGGNGMGGGMVMDNNGASRHKRTLSNKKNMGTGIQRRISQLQEKANANNNYYTGNKVEMADSPTDQIQGPNPLQFEQSNNY